MCGISYIQNFSDKSKINKILNSMRDRGPDGKDYKILDNNFFGFSYLSITGSFKKTKQPYIGKKSILIFNGEIFNFRELAKELNLTNKIKNDCDTEFLSACLEKYGIKKTLQKINGMWSFVYYDKEKKKTFIARDRFGIKPLFYTFFKKQLIIASSIKTILSYPQKKYYLNKTVVKNFLKSGDLNQNNETFFKNILSFPSNHYAELTKYKKKIILKKYSNFNIEEKKYELNDIKKNIKSSLISHFNQDIKTALPLSTGVDSNLLLKLYKNKSNLHCITLKNTNTGEEKLMKKNTKTNFIDCNKTHNLKFINKFIKVLDQPVRSFQPLYQYYIIKKAKKLKCRIITVGDGADEVFGGYKYSFYYFLADYIKKYGKKMGFHKAKQFKDFLNENEKEIFRKTQKLLKLNISYKKFMMKRILKTHIPYWLHISDLLSMNSSIENRVPYLDNKIVQIMMRSNLNYFYNNGINKFVISNLLGRKKNNKFHKPGNYNIIFNFLSKELIRLIKHNKYKFINKKKFIDNYKFDLRNNSKFMSKADYWSRVFFLLKWTEINKNLFYGIKF